MCRTLILVLDAHNSVIRYVAVIMPRKNPDCFIRETCHYNCDDLLRELYEFDIYYPENIQLKWRMIVRNLTEIDGHPYMLLPTVDSSSTKPQKLHTIIQIDMDVIFCGHPPNRRVKLFLLFVICIFLCVFQLLITNIQS